MENIKNYTTIKKNNELNKYNIYKLNIYYNKLTNSHRRDKHFKKISTNQHIEEVIKLSNSYLTIGFRKIDNYMFCDELESEDFKTNNIITQLYKFEIKKN